MGMQQNSSSSPPEKKMNVDKTNKNIQKATSLLDEMSREEKSGMKA
jgi:hypothetical protein